MKYRRCQPPFAVAFRKSANWGSDVEHEAMESKRMGLALSLPLSPEHVRIHVEVHRLNSRTVIYILPGGTRHPFRRSRGCVIYSSLRPILGLL